MFYKTLSSLINIIPISAKNIVLELIQVFNTPINHPNPPPTPSTDIHLPDCSPDIFFASGSDRSRPLDFLAPTSNPSSFLSPQQSLGAIEKRPKRRPRLKEKNRLDVTDQE